VVDYHHRRAGAARAVPPLIRRRAGHDSPRGSYLARLTLWMDRGLLQPDV
jgi:hypothetical protein